MFIVATRSGYPVAVAAEYRNQLVKVAGHWLFQCRRGREVVLPEDPVFPIIITDPDTLRSDKFVVGCMEQPG